MGFQTKYTRTTSCGKKIFKNQRKKEKLFSTIKNPEIYLSKNPATKSELKKLI